jgi:hypothetical protein
VYIVFFRAFVSLWYGKGEMFCLLVAFFMLRFGGNVWL